MATNVPLIANSKCPALMQTVKQIKGICYIYLILGVKMCNADALALALALALKYKGALALAL